MTDLQLELTKLIGSKELSFGCYIIVHGDTTRLDDNNFSISYDGKSYYHKETWDYETFDSGNRIHEWYVEQHIEITEIIGHPATLSDLHKFTITSNYSFEQDDEIINLWKWEKDCYSSIDFYYDLSKNLLEQSEETLQKIIAFIKANQ